jgi:hypothetical protein
VDALLSYPGHVIATMRSKTEWLVETDSKGKQRPVRVGLAPEQGKGIEYEFDLLLELSPDHVGRVIKDRTGRFQDQLIDRPDESFGRELAEWLSPEAVAEKPKRARRRAASTPTPTPEPDPAVPSDAIDAAFKAKVAKLIERTVQAGAWGPAEDYVHARFEGEQRAYALRELETAAAATVKAQAA